MDDAKAHPRFANFLKAMEGSFAFLVRDFGFEKIRTDVAGYECSVLYRKLPNIALRVLSEGTAPWVFLTARSGAAPNPKRFYEFPLESLAKKRIKGWKQPGLEGREPTREAIGDILDQYAKLLREEFPEVLEAADGVGAKLKEGGRPRPAKKK